MKLRPFFKYLAITMSLMVAGTFLGLIVAQGVTGLCIGCFLAMMIVGCGFATFAVLDAERWLTLTERRRW
jgi:hypothetical protein